MRLWCAAIVHLLSAWKRRERSNLLTPPQNLWSLRWLLPFLSLLLLIVAADLLPSFKLLHPFARRVAAQGCDPSVCGQWGTEFNVTDNINPTGYALMIHATLLPTGKVLFWNNRYDQNASYIAKAYIWDPTAPLLDYQP